MSQAALSAAEQFFREADTENTGFLTLQELTDLFRRKGYNMSDEQIRNMFNSIESKDAQKVTLEEFLQAMGAHPHTEHKKAHMRRVFRSFDKNGDGFIDLSELKAAFSQMNAHLTDEEIQRMMTLADKHNQGKINYEDFINSAFGAQK